MELKNVKIIKIEEIKTFDSGFSCVNWVGETQDDYPQKLQFQTNKDKAENLIKYNKVGDFVDVKVNLRGREWVSPQGETKYFNTIEAWSVFKSENNADNLAVTAEEISSEKDDLPF